GAARGGSRRQTNDRLPRRRSRRNDSGKYHGRFLRSTDSGGPWRRYRALRAAGLVPGGHSPSLRKLQRRSLSGPFPIFLPPHRNARGNSEGQKRPRFCRSVRAGARIMSETAGCSFPGIDRGRIAGGGFATLLAVGLSGTLISGLWFAGHASLLRLAIPAAAAFVGVFL